MTLQLKAILALTLTALLLFFGLGFKHEHKLRVAAEDRAKSAEHTLKVTQDQIKAEKRITETKIEAVNEIRKAPGASDPVSPAVSAAVRDGLKRVRSSGGNSSRQP